MDREERMYHPLQHQPLHRFMPSGSSQQGMAQEEDYSSRPSSNHSDQSFNLHPSGFDVEYASMLPHGWSYQFTHASQQHTLDQHHQHHHQYQPHAHQHDLQQPQSRSELSLQQHIQLSLMPFDTAAFGGPLHGSPVNYMPTTTANHYAVTTGMDTASFMPMAGPIETMASLGFPLNDYQTSVPFPAALNNAALQQHALNQHPSDHAPASVAGSSPSNTLYEIQSVSDHEWSLVNYNANRNSLDSVGTVSNPSQNLHIRTNSDSSDFSDDPHSNDLSGSYEDIPPWPLHSPHDFHSADYFDAQYIPQPAHDVTASHHHRQQSQSSSLAVVPPTVCTTAYRSAPSSSSSSTSPTSSGPTSPPLRRRRALTDASKTTKPVIKKPSSRRDTTAEKKIGRRRGPLRPEQRQQAHEIRKLRACIRCKFLKKTCDTGEPCAGCRPSHARLWQVPCTRMDIKDIAFFMKDWTADFERHITLGFSISNIKGFGKPHRTLYITHGYGHYLPIKVRDVFVTDDKCFEVDWVESIHDTPRAFEVTTAMLTATAEGIDMNMLSEYLDRHLDQGFEDFVDGHFEGTPFLTEILKTAFRFYEKEKNVAVRKALRLFLAYNLTQQVTMVEGLSDEEEFRGRIEVEGSRYHGKIVAPVMLNFQIKAALGALWRELHKDMLEELSALYSSVYSGDKLKNWPTIFMLAAILLALWEEMQFDCHYRIPDEKVVDKFCDEMETTPVGVIVGLFQAISTKLPGLQEWDTRKHHHLLGSNPAVCDALTEVKGHVNKYGIPLSTFL